MSKKLTIKLDNNVVFEGRFNMETKKLDDIIKKDLEKTAKVTREIVYDDGNKKRLMVYIDIPENRLHKKCEYCKDISRYCSRMSFFKSTGTSNEWSFAGVYLPFAGVAPSGWIRKIGSRFSPWHVPIMRHALSKVKDAGKLRENSESSLLIYMFLTRFGTWQVLQMSAALGGNLWEVVPELYYIREFILSHDLKKCVDVIPREILGTLELDYDLGVRMIESDVLDVERQFSEYAESKNIIQRYIISEEKDIEVTRDKDLINILGDRLRAFCCSKAELQSDMDEEDIDEEVVPRKL